MGESPHLEPIRDPAPASADWAALVAHDVRNLLAAAGGISEVLECETADPAAAERLRALRFQIFHAETLLEDLIVRSLGRPRPMGEVDLEVVAQQANASVRARAGRALQVEVVGPEQRLIVRGREHDLVRALCNLMWNALDAMRASAQTAPRLDVSWGLAGEAPFLQVRDYGPGLPAGFLGRRALSATTPDGRIHGLGLASVRHVLSEHGGVLVAEAAPGGLGTVMRMHFGMQRELAFDA